MANIQIKLLKQISLYAELQDKFVSRSKFHVLRLKYCVLNLSKFITINKQPKTNFLWQQFNDLKI